jgi:hypothetical protein
MAYFDLEPPHQEAWHQVAMLALNARRIAGDKKSKLRDFLPAPPPKVESPDDMAKKLRSMFPNAKHGIQGDDDDGEDT